MSRVWVICVLVVMLSYAYEARKSYNGYRLLQMRPTNNRQLRTLLRLQNTNSLELDFWKQPSLNHDVDLLVPPKVYNEVTKSLTQAKMEFKVVVTNIQTSMDIEQASMKHPDYLVDPAPYNWLCDTLGINCPTTTSTPPILSTPDDILETYVLPHQILEWLEHISGEHSELASLENIGKSYEGRDMTMIKLSTDPENNDKPVIWIEAGIHAREWISPAVAISIIDKMVKGYNVDDDVTRMLDRYDWHILPCANPDGYEFTHTDDRLWRKTRSKYQQTNNCIGVDPNRNFDVNFGGAGTSSDPCSNTYPGPDPFSESETANIRDAILKINGRIDLFLSFHSYSQLLLTPHGHTAIKPDDYNELESIAQASMEALRAVHGKIFQVGTPPDILYTATGGSYDWAKAKAGIKYAYTYELRPGGRASNGFVLPSTEIKPSSQEVWASLVTMVDLIYEHQTQRTYI